MILKEIAPTARSEGHRHQPGNAGTGQPRGLDVQVASATALPFEDASFDSVYSFKVSHVEEIESNVGSSRVLRPGGRAALEFYNKRSLRTSSSVSSSRMR